MSNVLWTGADFAGATRGRPIGELPATVTGLSIDTRTLQPGEAFFAIKGDALDGHDYLTAAVAAGAGLLVVSEHKLAALGKLAAPLLVVDDVLKSMERLAVAARARTKARIVAVTGSVGKTTTKDALREALGACGSVHASAASFNNHWGVPLSLARLPADADYAVFEIGMNHPGEIRPLVKMVRPHAAIVTLIAPAHLGFFSGLDEIAKAKGEIFEGVEPGGAAILNADDPFGTVLGTIARSGGISDVRTFGEVAGADYRLMAFEPLDDGSKLSARIGEVDVDVRLAASGRHVAQNVLAVLGAADILGADVPHAAEALSHWTAVKGRGARHAIDLGDGAPVTLIDESYNANPASMGAALAVLAAAQPAEDGRRIAVLGDMLELGGHSRRLHAELAGPIAEAGVDAVFLAGDEIRTLTGALPPAIHCEWHRGVGELEASLVPYLRAGDVVMVKASKGIGFAGLVDKLVARSAKSPDETAPTGGGKGISC
ncbi:UDP-N-acetylmuramoylalanyl-D-glutamyl-2,6-diaminopimelate--D-alanyl-D-alanine ligase [Aureimonas mangrovi]|uniref:UDP-N-acetylmuramoylalanyl-D-glutamyl-2, 6-diaminopimelate--D-alanyl-D-alanine ligase n=1 Tax=Aureimonas mangrovi TaxID=2758041 RepID=UPI00163DB735|nr:UDP-N-acetylmuramoylalanyl-D-glutamyl-2,6-diaminopimelate--D-alanyl-D-alanine ligase [Aureimonas mangrovi]